MTIAIPNSELFSPLTGNIDAACLSRGITVRRCTLEECGELLLANMVDAALVSPMGYGAGVGRVDYRIVPGPCLAIRDYTQVYGADFNPESNDLSTFHDENATSYLSTMMQLAMSEKFDIELRHVDASGPTDCRIGPPPSSASQALDLGEEWFDLAEAPLPVALWVIRVDSELEGFDALVAEAADSEMSERPVSEFVPLHADHSPREGAILYRWSDTVEEGLIAALNALYFHQHLREIPAVKLYGRD